ncbi:DUF5787 family protein [Haloquadratum walsbyi]|uniref:Uncharacterized protein n=1 Tax=Haloquadratum walsbyi J07HQW2 TaxID=1238425 RepID=U1MVW2_9EURY|nr:DUF5787 family protein [Haloquadratum walsbyi]ERG94554.1 MAG: hypothetical protein J07HQW2_00990 [Haloquadratum walsbyi J07HQW2]
MYEYPGNAEFGFELLVCRWAEQEWPPHDSNTDSDNSAIVISRQRGTQHRRWDTIVLECDPVGLEARKQFGSETLDSDLLRVVRWAPETWTWYREAIPQPDFPWRYVREAVHRAADRGILNTRRQGNRIEIKRVAAYPRWLRRIIAIENKPDLDASAARALGDQLQRDVETALADEVWVATAATNSQVEPILLKDLPAEVGILTFEFDPDAHHNQWAEASVIWHPTGLNAVTTQSLSDQKKIQQKEQTTSSSEHPEAGTNSKTPNININTTQDSTSNLRPTDTTTAMSDMNKSIDAEKYRRQLVLAERAYGAGWRSYHETMRPDCRHFELQRFGDVMIPYCAAKQRSQTATECAGDCSDFEPEPPSWRMREWPITGGPGARIKKLLTTRRERMREREISRLEFNQQSSIVLSDIQATDTETSDDNSQPE